MSRSSKTILDMEVYLKMGLPAQNVAALLKAEGKDEGEITAFIEKYNESRNKIKKLIRKFAEKIENKYGVLDMPELVRKGLKFAAKHNFNDAEKEAFKTFVVKGDMDHINFPFQEMEYTEMSKFLGFSNSPGLMLEIKPTDQENLHEIARLYELNKPLHLAIKANISHYSDCAPECIQGKYLKDKHNVSVFIHPLIAAMFIPQIEAIEKRMLYTNIGRMVVQRSGPYLRKYSAIHVGDTQEELKSDFELSYDIARDPNSLNYFSEESPMSNLLKRFKIQIELFRNVLKLREGKFYSRNEFGSDDPITGLTNVLSSYDWTYFDSPELYHIQDEGTMLRKLLAVFSLRPTYTQISPFMNAYGMGYSNFGVSRLSFVNTPIVNIRLPVNLHGSGAMPPVRLEAALTQHTHFVENKMIVPKNMSVIYSKDLIFFYANRRYQSVNFSNVDMSFRYLSLPGTLTNITSINTTILNFNDTLTIAPNNRFRLRSVVILNKTSDHEFATHGCGALLVAKPDLNKGMNRARYFYYNPATANVLHFANNQYISFDPITWVSYSSGNPLDVTFKNEASKNGTLFIFSEEL